MKRFFYVFITIGYLFMLISIFIKADNFSLIIGSAVIAAVFATIVILGRRLDDLLEKRYALFTAGILLFAAVLQSSHIELLRFTPIFDMAGIFDGASEIVERGDFSPYYAYFGTYFNNYGAMRLLYHVFRVGHLFSKDYFLIAAVFNEITLLLTFLFASLIAKRLFGARFGILTLLFFISMPPFIFMTDVFYTDSLSILYPVLLIYLAMINHKRTKLFQWLICVLFAVVSFIGGSIKPNVYIVSVAVCLGELVFRNYKRFLQYVICLLVICIGFHALSMGYEYRHYISKEDLQKTKTPIIHWVMMGLGETGRYDVSDEAFTQSFDDPDERDRAILEKIGERLRNRGFIGMVQLFRDKSFIDYGDGTLGLSDFLDDGPENESQLHEHILYAGEYYYSYYVWCCAIFYAIMILGAVGVLLEFFCGFMHQRRNLFLPALAFFGDWAFLMMWEATQRYCTNYLPLLMIMASGGVYYLETLLEKHGLTDRISAFFNKYGRESRVFAYSIGLSTGLYLCSLIMMIIFRDQGQYVHLHDLVEGWQRWDAYYYLLIAGEGYSKAWAADPGILRCLPLYPWLIKTLHIFVSNTVVCGMIISALSFSVGCVFLDKLMQKETGIKQSRYVLLALICYPFAFLYGAIEPEALFFMLCAMFFYYLRKHKWNMTAIIGMLACMTRLQGLLFIIAVAVELMYYKRGLALVKKRKTGEFVRRLGIPFTINLSMLAGFLVYLAINYTVSGNPFSFVSSSFSFIWKTIAYIMRFVRDSWGSPEWLCIWLPEAILFFLFILCVVYMIRRRMRPVYYVYLAAYGMVLYSSSWLLNGPRLTIGALPLFIAIGSFIGEKPEKRQWILLCSAILSILYLGAYLRYLPIL